MNLILAIIKVKFSEAGQDKMFDQKPENAEEDVGFDLDEFKRCGLFYSKKRDFDKFHRGSTDFGITGQFELN